MSRPRIYATNAERQRAYRSRCNGIALRKAGRPRIWANAKAWMHAWWMRNLAQIYGWSGFWAEDARKVRGIKPKQVGSAAAPSPASAQAEDCLRTIRVQSLTSVAGSLPAQLQFSGAHAVSPFAMNFSMRGVESQACHPLLSQQKNSKSLREKCPALSIIRHGSPPHLGLRPGAAVRPRRGRPQRRRVLA